MLGVTRRGAISTRPWSWQFGTIDRFSIGFDIIDRVPKLRVRGAHAKENFKNQQIACLNYAYENGIDKPEIVGWKWPF